jgi:hypothetical protein
MDQPINQESRADKLALLIHHLRPEHNAQVTDAHELKEPEIEPGALIVNYGHFASELLPYVDELQACGAKFITYDSKIRNATKTQMIMTITPEEVVNFAQLEAEKGGEERQRNALIALVSAAYQEVGQRQDFQTLLESLLQYVAAGQKDLVLEKIKTYQSKMDFLKRQYGAFKDILLTVGHYPSLEEDFAEANQVYEELQNIRQQYPETQERSQEQSQEINEKENELLRDLPEEKQRLTRVVDTFTSLDELDNALTDAQQEYQAFQKRLEKAA